MNRDEFIKKLHPAITHIRASDEMSEETLEAINAMVEKVFHMSAEQLKAASEEWRKNQKVEVEVEAGHECSMCKVVFTSEESYNDHFNYTKCGE